MIDTNKYEEYQNARVEGFIPAEWEFEDYLLAEVKRLREGRLDLINEVIRIINNKKFEDYLLAEVKRLREGRLDLINEVIRIINNKTGERVDADLHDYIIDRLVNE